MSVHTDFISLVETLKALSLPLELPESVFNDDNSAGPPILSGAERNLVLSSIEPTAVRMQTVIENIGLAESLQEFLCIEKNRMERLLTRARNQVAPIHRLPVELLREIFLLVHATGDLQSAAVSEVNQVWREVPLAMPKLWTRVVVCVATDKPRPQSTSGFGWFALAIVPNPWSSLRKSPKSVGTALFIYPGD